MSKVLIYVAGPLSGKDGKIGALPNVYRAIDIGEQLYNRGHVVYIPHLSVFHHKILQRLRPGYKPTYERWLKSDFEIIKRCDALFYIAPSPGADKEVDRAREYGIPIYTKIEDVPNIVAGKREAFTNLFAERLVLLVERGREHGDSSISVLGIDGLAFLLLMKALRLVNVVKGKEVDIDELAERVKAIFREDSNAIKRLPDDTLMDLANYADITMLYIRDEWNLPWGNGDKTGVI